MTVTKLETHFLEGGKLKWARRHTECCICHTTDYKHCGRGRCVGCYEKARIKTPTRIKKHRQYALKYSRTHKPSDLAMKNNREWRKKVNEIHVILAKGRRWKREGKVCMLYKNRPIPLDITSREKEIQRKWKAVKDYIDNQKCGKKP